MSRDTYSSIKCSELSPAWPWVSPRMRHLPPLWLSPEPSFLQAAQSQLSQPVLTMEVFHPLDHFCDPPRVIFSTLLKNGCDVASLPVTRDFTWPPWLLKYNQEWLGNYVRQSPQESKMCLISTHRHRDVQFSQAVANLTFAYNRRGDVPPVPTFQTIHPVAVCRASRVKTAAKKLWNTSAFSVVTCVAHFRRGGNWTFIFPLMYTQKPFLPFFVPLANPVPSGPWLSWPHPYTV